jgi:hypothetical protein
MGWRGLKGPQGMGVGCGGMRCRGTGPRRLQAQVNRQAGTQKTPLVYDRAHNCISNPTTFTSHIQHTLQKQGGLLCTLSLC